MATTNKFEQTLNATNKEIKANRARIITEQSADAMQELLREARQKKRDVEVALLDLSDVHVESKTSLNVAKKEFDAKSWLHQIRNRKIELLNAEIELQVVEEMYQEWFGAVEVETETAVANG